jgi:hypothetical protein
LGTGALLFVRFVFLAHLLSASGQEVASPPLRPPLSDAVASCKTNLNCLYEAFLEYYKANQAWPERLSDLHPEYISDSRRLMCPELLRNGDLMAGRRGIRPDVFEDVLPVGYSYELCSKAYPLWAGLHSTEREYKLRQMRLVGSNIPIVRCRGHARVVLNLSMAGQIYENVGRDWESHFSNTLDIARLLPVPIFRDFAPVPGGATNGLLPRAPGTSARLLDLDAHYIAVLQSPWLWRNPSGADLSELPRGVVSLSGAPVPFDVRGLIQLTSSTMIPPFPTNVDGIKVQQKCRRLHFLQGAVLGDKMYSSAARDQAGSEIGWYQIHYADGRQQRVPLRYGLDVLNWDPMESGPLPPGVVVAWEGANGISRKLGRRIRLYCQQWENPYGDIELASLDFHSSMARAAPFLVAVTVEP